MCSDFFISYLCHCWIPHETMTAKKKITSHLRYLNKAVYLFFLWKTFTLMSFSRDFIFTNMINNFNSTTVQILYPIINFNKSLPHMGWEWRYIIIRGTIPSDWRVLRHIIIIIIAIQQRQERHSNKKDGIAIKFIGVEEVNIVLWWWREVQFGCENLIKRRCYL
jgi:hypothetical protein